MVFILQLTTRQDPCLFFFLTKEKSESLTIEGFATALVHYFTIFLFKKKFSHFVSCMIQCMIHLYIVLVDFKYL